MAISNIPTFTDGELPSAAKLNQLGDALTTKFSGAVSGADMVWPLVVQDNIDMNSSYSLTNLRTLWNVVNVAEYDTFTDAVAALPSAGGCLFIPPGTVTTDGVEIDTSNVLVLGTGRGSVLKITSGATSGYLVRTATGLSNVGFANLEIDGNTNTGSGQDGIQFRDCDGVHLTNVYFDDFSGESLVLTHSGTQGNPCENVQIVSCHFVDGSGDQLLMDDVDGVQIVGCVFENPTTKAINGTPSTSASYMRSIVVSGCNFSDANNSVYIIGGSGTASDNWRSIRIVDNEIISDAGNGITCGTTAAIVKYGYVIDNLIISVTGDGINALLSGGRIACNYCDAAGGDGLDLLASTAATAAVTVCDNTFTNATTAGIDVNTSTSCTICHNDVTGSATPIDVSGATTPILVSNIGHDDPPARNGVFYGTQITHTGTVTRTKKWTFTIPANTIPAAGDGVRVMMAGEHSSNGNAIVEFEVGGMQTGDSTAFSVSEYNYEAVIVNTSAGNQRFSSVATGDGAASAANGTGTVDFTADQDVDIYLTLSDTGGTATIDHVQVEYFRLEAGGASA